MSSTWRPPMLLPIHLQKRGHDSHYGLMTIKEIIAELPKLTQAEKRELRRAIDRELAFGPRGPKDAERNPNA